MKELFTIGYEGTTIGDVVASLAAAGVEVLIDVREVPLSRKPGFSKRTLAEHLGKAGIHYAHLVELGDPKPGRVAARNGNQPEFVRIYKKHLERREAQDALQEAVGIATASKACLFCFERDPSTCHRKMVAETMASRNGFTIKHLGAQPGLASKKGGYRGTFTEGLRVA